VCLMIAMSLSTTSVRLSHTFKQLLNWRPLVTIIILNYIILTALILILGWLFDFSWYIWAGIVVMAAVPPAVAVIPFTELLKGDSELSVGATTVLYIASLILTPLIILLFLGADTDIWELVKALILMIIIPLFISRVLREYKTDEKLGDYKPAIINLAFAVLIFTVIGINRSVFFENIHLVIALIFISMMRTFAIGTIIFSLAQKAKIPRARNVTYTLFASYKNLGLAIVLAFGLFGAVATIPATICIPFEILTFIYLKKLI
ncbi:MAG: hypothetical protein JSV49_12420, partial [Thermoplasmata archaeon]